MSGASTRRTSRRTLTARSIERADMPRRAERTDYWQPTGDQVATMSEDELFIGLTQALTLAGWRWYHVIRSDGVSMGTGAVGFPDLFAVHPTRSQAFVWELKGTGGQPTIDQWAWIGPLAVVATLVDKPATFDARIVGPADYDAALHFILGKTERFGA